MNRDNSPTDYGSSYQGGHPSQNQGFPNTPEFQGKPPFSAKEVAVMKECQTESFMYRALPMSILGALLGTAGVRQGYLRPHPTFGAGPKSCIFAIAGFIAGKASYIPECQNKILNQIPNTRLANSVRRAKGMPLVQLEELEYDDSIQTNEEKPWLANNNDDSDKKQEITSHSYDDLRKINRQRYKELTEPPTLPKRSPVEQFNEKQQSPPEDFTPPPRPKRLNKYGDEIFD